MHESFAKLLSELKRKYELLMEMAPQTVDTVPALTPKGGVYLFTENGKHLYAGRTKRNIGKRLKDHVGTAKDCPFAWRLAKEATGKKATYKKAGSRADLLADPSFLTTYEAAKLRIRKMEVRYVAEEDPLRQALLEIYVAVVSKAAHNDFDTH
ncbi:MAG: hypothetical protein AB1393_05145 [Candidatus Edwardsbacteria bacterium]